jgi:hypothetical protein
VGVKNPRQICISLHTNFHALEIGKVGTQVHTCTRIQADHDEFRRCATISIFVVGTKRTELEWVIQICVLKTRKIGSNEGNIDRLLTCEWTKEIRTRLTGCCQWGKYSTGATAHAALPVYTQTAPWLSRVKAGAVTDFKSFGAMMARGLLLRLLRKPLRSIGANT